MFTRRLIEYEMQPNLAMLKDHLRITTNDQDKLLSAYLKAACNAAENFIGRHVQASIYTIEGAYTPVISLPRASAAFPIQEIVVEVDGSACTNYSISGNSWIEFGPNVSGSRVKIVYRCGGNVIPDDIQIAILLIASKYYANPVDSVETLPTAAYNLLSNYRTYGIED